MPQLTSESASRQVILAFIVSHDDQLRTLFMLSRDLSDEPFHLNYQLSCLLSTEWSPQYTVKSNTSVDDTSSFIHFARPHTPTNLSGNHMVRIGIAHEKISYCTGRHGISYWLTWDETVYSYHSPWLNVQIFDPIGNNLIMWPHLVHFNLYHNPSISFHYVKRHTFIGMTSFNSDRSPNPPLPLVTLRHEMANSLSKHFVMQKWTWTSSSSHQTALAQVYSN
jgi:hypothetical protein